MSLPKTLWHTLSHFGPQKNPGRKKVVTMYSQQQCLCFTRTGRWEVPRVAPGHNCLHFGLHHITPLSEFISPASQYVFAYTGL